MENVKNGVKHMTYDGFEIKHSPFQQIDEFRKTKGDRVSVRTDIAPEDYELIEKYIKLRDPDFDPKKKNNSFDNSKFVRELLMNFFNSITLEKKSFENLHIVLLFPKTQDADELELKGEIVGALEGEDVFLKNPFKYAHSKRNKFNFIFKLEDFNERNYNDLLLLNRKKERLFFQVSQDIQDDFYKVKSRLSDVYYDLDLDECYFTIVNVNNYLDVLNEGQYTSNWSSFHHEGFIVLLDPLDKLQRLCLSISWACYHDLCETAFEVIDEGDFNETILEQIDNEEILKEYSSITQVYSFEHAIRRRIEDDKNNIEYWTQRLQEHEELLLKHTKNE